MEVAKQAATMTTAAAAAAPRRRPGMDESRLRRRKIAAFFAYAAPDGAQPRCMWSQQKSFFSLVQEFCQSQNFSLQSKCLWTSAKLWLQPSEQHRQHHCCWSRVQLKCHESKFKLQSYVAVPPQSPAGSTYHMPELEPDCSRDALHGLPASVLKVTQLLLPPETFAPPPPPCRGSAPQADSAPSCSQHHARFSAGHCQANSG
mmetsp:Transcript_17600/g.50217  ORF Transcript_17600/g.50217 Transcript_17600/m.50217 type:complete len:202 (+) Transcript_17600:221-826(+)